MPLLGGDDWGTTEMVRTGGVAYTTMIHLIPYLLIHLRGQQASHRVSWKVTLERLSVSGHSRGRRFDPARLHHRNPNKNGKLAWCPRSTEDDLGCASARRDSSPAESDRQCEWRLATTPREGNRRLEWESRHRNHPTSKRRKRSSPAPHWGGDCGRSGSGTSRKDATYSHGMRSTHASAIDVVPRTPLDGSPDVRASALDPYSKPAEG